ncbi:MAG TPA: DUF6285 domain-containing protein [Candidatus Binataceae bacterium]|nr:DUF6285 domain-containing protein [Candidatus Binataceae bacterium]
MQDRPSAIELLEAAADFVDREIVTTTEGRVQFQSRVVANVMRIAAREIRDEDRFARAELRALAAVLKCETPHVHGLDDVREAAARMGGELSAGIRAGAADRDPRRAQVMAAVRQIVEDKLRIANPRYLEADLAIRAERRT